VQAAASNPKPAFGCLYVDLAVVKGDSKSTSVMCHHVPSQLDRKPTTSTTSKPPFTYCIVNFKEITSKEETPKKSSTKAFVSLLLSLLLAAD